MDLSLESVAILASCLSQPLEGGGLRVIYLAKKVCYQLAGEDAPRVPMDLLVFILAPCSMTDTEYDLWRLGIPFTNQIIDELDYDKFSGTHLMPSLTILVCVLAPLISFNQ